MIVRTTTGRGFGGLIAYITHDAPTDDVRHPESSSRVGMDPHGEPSDR